MLLFVLVCCCRSKSRAAREQARWMKIWTGQPRQTRVTRGTRARQQQSHSCLPGQPARAREEGAEGCLGSDVVDMRWLVDGLAMIERLALPWGCLKHSVTAFYTIDGLQMHMLDWTSQA